MLLLRSTRQKRFKILSIAIKDVLSHIGSTNPQTKIVLDNNETIY